MKSIKFLLIISSIFLLPTFSFARSQVVINPISYQIGNIEEGLISQYKIEIENAGDSELIVSAPYVSCGCLKIISPKEKTKVLPGDKMYIDFSFNSSGYSGEVLNYIYFNTNDPQKPSVSIEVKAKVIAKKETLIDRFKTWGLATIITASFLDSINPCAFTVIVFFISFLSFAGYKKRPMVLVGGAFILAVFISYILIGLGLFQFLRQVTVFKLLSKAVYLITAFLALGLGFYSLYDAWIFHKTKDPDKIVLKLPSILKSRIQAVIREKTEIRPERVEHGKNIWALVFSALSCGFIVSVLEFACTGQLYLPTIVYILKVPDLRLKAAFYLILYNLVFILPLVTILYLGIWGVTSQQFSNFFRKHLGMVKLATAILFFVLGSSLLIFIRK